MTTVLTDQERILRLEYVLKSLIIEVPGLSEQDRQRLLSSLISDPPLPPPPQRFPKSK